MIMDCKNLSCYVFSETWHLHVYMGLEAYLSPMINMIFRNIHQHDTASLGIMNQAWGFTQIESIYCSIQLRFLKVYVEAQDLCIMKVLLLAKWLTSFSTSCLKLLSKFTLFGLDSKNTLWRILHFSRVSKAMLLFESMRGNTEWSVCFFVICLYIVHLSLGSHVLPSFSIKLFDQTSIALSLLFQTDFPFQLLLFYFIIAFLFLNLPCQWLRCFLQVLHYCSTNMV